MDKKRGRGRPAGAKNKPKPVVTETPRRKGGGILRDAIEKAYSEEKLIRILQSLTPAEAARVMASVEPRRKEESEQKSVFNLIVEGLSPRCLKCGTTREYAPCKCGFVEPPKSTTSVSTNSGPAREDGSGSTETSSTDRKDAHLPLPKGLPGDFFQEDPKKPEPPVHFSINRDSLDLG